MGISAAEIKIKEHDEHLEEIGAMVHGLIDKINNMPDDEKEARQ